MGQTQGVSAGDSDQLFPRDSSVHAPPYSFIYPCVFYPTLHGISVAITTFFVS